MDLLSYESQGGLSQHVPGGLKSQKWRIRFEWLYDTNELKVNVCADFIIGLPHEKEEDILENIIKSFNERWFQGWEATPDEQRVKFLQISKQIKAHPDYETKVAKNADQQNSDLALKRIMEEVMRNQRKNELDLYRLFAKDDSFYQAFFNSMKVMIEKNI